MFGYVKIGYVYVMFVYGWDFSKKDRLHTHWMLNRRIEFGFKLQSIFEFEINFSCTDYGVEKQTVQINDHNSPKNDCR